MTRKEIISALVKLLTEAGLEREKAEALLRKAVKVARCKHSPIVNTLRGFANPGAHRDSKEFHLHLALQNVSTEIAKFN